MTSTGKKRGRPRKNPELNNETLPNLNYHLEDSMMEQQSPLSQSMSSLPAKREAQEEYQQHLQQQQQQLSASPEVASHQPARLKGSQLQAYRPAKRIHWRHKLAATQAAAAAASGASGSTGTVTPTLHEPKIKHISMRKEEMNRLREESSNLRLQLNQLQMDYDELKRQTSYTGLTVPKTDFEDLKEKYQRDITYAKRHEWCAVCLTQSKYYCCWNTTYCSQKCQVTDWYARHSKACERVAARFTTSKRAQVSSSGYSTPPNHANRAILA